jgi:cytochrome bd-type quinol oxidase subunit 2
MDIIRLLVFLIFAGILISLGSALFHLTRGHEHASRKMARALALRIALSLALFLLLMIGWYMGLIKPHAGPLQAPP